MRTRCFPGAAGGPAPLYQRAFGAARAPHPCQACPRGDARPGAGRLAVWPARIALLLRQARGGRPFRPCRRRARSCRARIQSRSRHPIGRRRRRRHAPDSSALMSGRNTGRVTRPSRDLVALTRQASDLSTWIPRSPARVRRTEPGRRARRASHGPGLFKRFRGISSRAARTPVFHGRLPAVLGRARAGSR